MKQHMKRQEKKIQRPKSITAIGWILIITGGMLTVAAAGNLNTEAMQKYLSEHPLPMPAYYAITFGGFLIYIISGAGILKGQNWGRLLFLGWSIIGFAISAVTAPAKADVLPGLLIFVIIILFLFRDPANKYFSSPQHKTAG